MLWAIYWRYLLVIIIVIAALAGLEQRFLIVSGIENTRYSPTVFWSLATALSGFLILVLPKGPMHFVVGGRLLQTERFWLLLNLSLCGLFVFLAIFALATQAVTNTTLWGYYKLYCQPAVLLFYPLIASFVVLQKTTKFLNES